VRSSLKSSSGIAISVGAVFFALHLYWSWLIIVDLYDSKLDAQWQLAWVAPFFVDFPISLLSLISLIFIPSVDLPFLPYPASSLNAFLLPAFVHGVLGPLYWFSIPIWVSAWRARRREPQQGQQ
jgi:hypothetical protein